MNDLLEISCGLDVHKEKIVACILKVDMLNLAKDIMEWTLQICVEVDGEKYLLAHAYTSMPECKMNSI